MLNQAFGQALTDEEGRFLQVNRGLCDLLGFEAAALLRRGVRDVTHPDDWPSNSARLHRLRADDEPFSIVKRALRADGTVVWVQSYVSILRDAQERPVISALVRPVLPEQDRVSHWAGQTTAVQERIKSQRPVRPGRGLPPGRILH